MVSFSFKVEFKSRVNILKKEENASANTPPVSNVDYQVTISDIDTWL